LLGKSLDLILAKICFLNAKEYAELSKSDLKYGKAWFSKRILPKPAGR